MLLIKSIVTLIFTIVMFILDSLPFMKGMSLAWIALLGAMLILILANKHDLEGVMAHVEWTTLLFFAGWLHNSENLNFF